MIKLERSDPYIDDILHTKGEDFGEHLQILDEILERLKASDMQINLKKSTLCTKNLEFLGFQLDPTVYRLAQKWREATICVSNKQAVNSSEKCQLRSSLMLYSKHRHWSTATDFIHGGGGLASSEL